jgi:hypothetical protein
MQAFQWPPFDDEGTSTVPTPAWVHQEIRDTNIRLSDDLAHVHDQNGDWRTVRTGEWILKMNGNLHVCTDDIFRQMTRGAPPEGFAGDEIVRTDGREPDPNPNPYNAQVEGADAADTEAPQPNPNPSGPPYSSAVLARSAAARERQAIYDAQQAASPKSNP